MRVGNVFCVGRNYKLHAAELGNDVPTGPMIFMKPTHAVVPMNGNVVALPASFGSIHYEAEMVVRIGRRYEKGVRAERMVDAFALGIDFTLRDVQNELKQKQHPWLKAKGFKSSAPLTAFQPLDSLETLYSHHFSLTINGEERQRGHLKDTLFDLQTLVDEIGTHYGLDEGDLLFTGTPAGVGAVRDGDRMALLWGGRPLGECTVRLD
jgi:2-keto-4-pentenoate hydratase/2-oxohepta-3-ene-1,7-dioic acid hydratase in catechol pathway